MVFKPVKQDRIAVAIVNQLKAAILSGRFKPGERMPTERALTEQFQVSRVVVREAIRELEIKGFVKILQGPSGGAYVTDLSFDQINNAFLDLFHSNKLSVAELIQTRILVECEIARLACGQTLPESAAPLLSGGQVSGVLPGIVAQPERIEKLLGRLPDTVFVFVKASCSENGFNNSVP